MDDAWVPNYCLGERVYWNDTYLVEIISINQNRYYSDKEEWDYRVRELNGPFADLKIACKENDLSSPSEHTKESNDSMESNDYKHPSYYNVGKIEVIDFIQDKNLNFSLGNVVKYVCRAGLKDNESKLKDLKKARNYIDFEIAALEKGKE